MWHLYLFGTARARASACGLQRYRSPVPLMGGPA
jgi:hypothetical protein